MYLLCQDGEVVSHLSAMNPLVRLQGALFCLDRSVWSASWKPAVLIGEKKVEKRLWSILSRSTCYNEISCQYHAIAGYASRDWAVGVREKKEANWEWKWELSHNRRKILEIVREDTIIHGYQASILFCGDGYPTDIPAEGESQWHLKSMTWGWEAGACLSPIHMDGEIRGGYRAFLKSYGGLKAVTKQRSDLPHLRKAGATDENTASDSTKEGTSGQQTRPHSCTATAEAFKKRRSNGGKAWSRTIVPMYKYSSTFGNHEPGSLIQVCIIGTCLHKR